MPYPTNFRTTEAIAMKIGTNVTDYKSIKMLSMMISEEKERKMYEVPFYLNFTFFVEMAPISNAEKCRRYREKYRDKYRKAHVLRKKHQWVVVKKDPVANEIQLKTQREKKKEYRERILKEKSQTNKSFESSSLSLFSNKAVKGRSLKRACYALPKNPQQRSEIVRSLSKKFDLRINLSTKKPGRPGNELCTDEIDWLSEFME